MQPILCTDLALEHSRVAAATLVHDVLHDTLHFPIQPHRGPWTRHDIHTKRASHWPPQEFLVFCLQTGVQCAIMRE